MPRAILGKLSREYSSENEFRVPYYRCRAEAVEAKEGNLCARYLPDGRIAVFGDIEIFFLLSYTSGSESSRFCQKYERSIAEIFEQEEVLKALGAEKPDSLELEAEFTPHPIGRLTVRAGFVWEVTVTGRISVTAYRSESSTGTEAREEPEPSPAEDFVVTAPCNARRILPKTDIDTLLALDPGSRETFLEKPENT